MRLLTVIVVLILFFGFSSELNNGLGRTPQMGKRSNSKVDIYEKYSIEGWNHFGCNVDEKLIKNVADTIISTGLAKAGYEYGLFNLHLSFECYSFSLVNMDDCWQVYRDTNGTIHADPQAFPSGIPALSDYIHSRNLKFGLYSGKILCFRDSYLLYLIRCRI